MRNLKTILLAFSLLPHITIFTAAACFLFIVSTSSQSIDKPLTVNPSHVFTWDDTNSPPCVGYTVYGKSQSTGAVTRTYATTTNRLTYGTLFSTNHPTGLNAVSVIGWDSDGKAGDLSTNYYVNWTPLTPTPPKPPKPPKGKPVRLRTL